MDWHHSSLVMSIVSMALITLKINSWERPNLSTFDIWKWRRGEGEIIRKLMTWKCLPVHYLLDAGDDLLLLLRQV